MEITSRKPELKLVPGELNELLRSVPQHRVGFGRTSSNVIPRVVDIQQNLTKTLIIYDIIIPHKTQSRKFRQVWGLLLRNSYQWIA